MKKLKNEELEHHEREKRAATSRRRTISRRRRTTNTGDDTPYEEPCIPVPKDSNGTALNVTNTDSGIEYCSGAITNSLCHVYIILFTSFLLKYLQF